MAHSHSLSINPNRIYKSHLHSLHYRCRHRNGLTLLMDMDLHTLRHQTHTHTHHHRIMALLNICMTTMIPRTRILGRRVIATVMIEVDGVGGVEVEEDVLVALIVLGNQWTQDGLVDLDHDSVAQQDVDTITFTSRSIILY